MNKLKGNKDAKAGQGQPAVAQPPQQVPARYPPPGPQPPMQQPGPGYQPPYPMGQQPPYRGPAPNPASSYGNDVLLSNLSGLSPADIAHLRHEFYNYANALGVIDRDGFRKLYIASLVNKTWEEINHEAEMAFRNFDINQTGGLGFNEYISACSRMLRGGGNLGPPMMYQY